MLLNVFAAMLLAASPYRPVPGQEPRARPILTKPLTATPLRCPASQIVTKLPYAHGRGFCALDDYLAHLERFAAPIDQPWWKQVRPGVYARITTTTYARHEIATRAQLIKRFKFSR